MNSISKSHLPPAVGAGLRPAPTDTSSTSPTIQRRRSLRLRDYDYATSGGYFITACVHQHKCLFGRIHTGEVVLNEFGRIVESCWQELPMHFSNVILDVFVVMPNHIHGVLFLKDGSGKRKNLSEIVRAFKSFSARHINQLRNSPGQTVWQRSFYDHIVRSEKSLEEIRKYVLENPLRWEYSKTQSVRSDLPLTLGAGLRPVPYRKSRPGR